PGGCGFAVEGEQGGHVRPAVAVGQGLADQGVGHQRVLDRGGGDVLPAGGDDQFLLPVGHRDESVGVDGADVAGVQPPVRVEQVTGQVGPVQVAGGGQRPAGQDLAVAGDRDLHASVGAADRAELERGGGVGGERPGRLGDPVDVEDLQVQPGKE